MGAGSLKRNEIYPLPNSQPLAKSELQREPWGGSLGVGEDRPWEARVGMGWGRESGVRLGRKLFLPSRGQVLGKIDLACLLHFHSVFYSSH